MKCVIAFTTAILVLNSAVWAQHNTNNATKVNIALLNGSNDLETTLTNLGLQFNRSAVVRLTLRNIYMQHENPIFTGHFKEFSSLHTLRLEKGNVSILPNSTFENWKCPCKSTGKSLHLIDIGLRSVSKEVLKPLSDLEELSLSRNHLTDFPSDIFNYTSRVTELDISYNKLMNWSQDIFVPLESLTTLYMNNNNIASLNADIFSSQKTNLMWLDLSFNNIQQMHPGIFNGSILVYSLNLSHAFNPNYTQLPSNVFKQMGNLTHLYVDQNNFQDLPEDIFSDLKKLQHLDLSDNSLTHLPPKIFAENKELQFLNLYGNNLTYLDNSLFLTLGKLEDLNLANNQLIFSDGTNIFSSLFSLKTIRLDNNKAVRLTLRGSTSVLKNCTYLQQIFASNTNITEIYSDWLFLEHLEQLDLMNTPVGEIHGNFTFQSNKVELRLIDNSNELVIFDQDLAISRNDEADKLLILDKDQKCGKKCACVFEVDQYRQLVELRCIRFDKTELPHRIPDLILLFLQTYKYKIDFMLSNCASVDFDQLNEYLKQVGSERVRTLALSNNKLEDTGSLKANYLTNLEVLELHNNNFTWLNPDIVKQLGNSQVLKEVTLNKNQWSCGCTNQDFINFVKNNGKSKIPNVEDVLCNDGTRVDDFDIEARCYTTQNSIIHYIITILATLAALCAITILIYYRYNFYIDSYLYQYHEYLPKGYFPDEEKLENDVIYNYDAFVCYAKADEAFVETRLVPMLEQQEPKLKLCIHQRDWPIGGRIPTEIYKSVRQSRRTLVVLTHSFMQSNWCMSEFQVARDRAAYERINRLVVIKLEDIASHRLNADLRAYISAYTYIPWVDNDWFWTKLRYALYLVRIMHIKTDPLGSSDDEQSEMIQEPNAIE